MLNITLAIIGAGVAGLAAFSRLMDFGYTNITIFEANDRIGGRINSVKIGDAYVDLGAQWCHGKEGNVVYELAKEYLDDPIVKLGEDFSFSISDGRTLDLETSTRILQFLLNLTNSEELESSDGSFGEFIDMKLEKLLNEDVEDEEFLHLVLMGKQWFEKAQLVLNGCSNWYMIPANTIFVKNEGEQHLQWNDKGYRTILDILTKGKESALKEKLLLNKDVSEIAWKSEKFPEVDTRRIDSSKVVIKCTDGSSYEFDHVIFTGSLGVLKAHHKELFNPNLPPEKVEAIQHMGMGLLNKVILIFPERWWPEDSIGYSLIWTEEDRIEAIDEFPNWPILNGKTWLEMLMAFNLMESQPNGLVTWIMGELAEEVEKLADEEILRGCMYVLRKFLGRHFNITDPIIIEISRWTSEPNILGSYSFYSQEAKQFGVLPSDLAEPLFIGEKPVVLFAGEATNNPHHSTVHGAIESGWREADRLIKGSLYKKPQKEKNPPIAIIGAGVSGIAAASRLIDKNLTNITIFEGENRIGGRINSILIGNAYVDLGAQWCHGKKGNVVYELAKDHLGFPNISIKTHRHYFLSDGEQIDDEYRNQIDEIYGEIHSSSELGTFEGSLGEFMDLKLKEKLNKFNGDEELVRLIMLARDWQHKLYMSYYAIFNLYDLPTNAPHEQIKRGNFHWKDKGYKAILDILMEGKEAIMNDKIILNKVAEEIIWKNPNRQEKKEGVTIKFEDGSIQKFDHVIFTGSLGVLKENHESLFKPKLPHHKTEAIKLIPMGLVNKIILVFSERWWPEDSDGLCFLWTEEDRREVPEKFKWTVNLFDLIRVDSHENVLLGFHMGEIAIETEMLTDEDIMEGCIYLMRKFLGKHFNVLDPIDVKVSRWYSSQNFLGSHSSYNFIEKNAGITPTKLAEPLFIGEEPVVLFAGEATNNKHPAMVHGAIETGWREAERLANWIHKGLMTNNYHKKNT